MTSYIIFALTYGTILLIASWGLYILTRLCGQVSLTQGAYVGVGAVVSSYLSRSSTKTSGVLLGRGLPFIGSLLIAMIITGILAALFSLVCIRLRGSSALVGSVAVSIVILFICERLTFLSGGAKGATSSKSLTFGHVDFENLTLINKEYSKEAGVLILYLLIAAAVFVYVRNVARSPLARSMKAVAESEKIARMCEVSPVKTIVYANFLAGMCAGIAGSLLAHVLGRFEIDSANPLFGTFGLILSIQILLIVAMSYWSRSFYIASLIMLCAGSAFYLLIKVFQEENILGKDGMFTPYQIASLILAALAILVIRLDAYRSNKT